MSYRPQFPFPTPEGFHDEDFIQHFDQHNVSALSIALTPGASVLQIPLQLQSDIQFHVRAITVSGEAEDVLGVRFKDPWGNYLSDDFVPAGVYNGGQGTQPGGIAVVFEGEIECPPGSVLFVDIKNLS